MATSFKYMSRDVRFQQCGMCNQQSLRSACAYAQSDQSLCWPLEYSVSLKILTEHHLELLSLTGGCTGTSESTLVKMPHCWKSQVTAHIMINMGSLFLGTLISSLWLILMCSIFLLLSPSAISLKFIWSLSSLNWPLHSSR